MGVEQDMRVRVKICGVRNEADLKAAVDAGADAIGLLVGQLHASPDFILPSTASRLAAKLPPYVTPIIVTHLTDPDAIMEIVVQTGITNIQLHGGSSVEQVAALRETMPLNSKLILAAHVSATRCELDFSGYLKLVDAILLDSRDGDRVGGTGAVHNWNISEAIARSCHLPVILAGGLNPSNVADAVRKVRPFAVDANSGLKAPDGSRSPELCAAFAKNAIGAFSAV